MSRANKNRNKRIVARKFSDRRIIRKNWNTIDNSNQDELRRYHIGAWQRERERNEIS